MTVTVSLKGLETFKKKLATLGEASRFEDDLKTSAHAIAISAAENLSQVTSSAASGKLQSSIDVSPGDHSLSWRIGTQLQHGAYIEFGTVNTVARPWLSPTLADEKQNILTRLRQLLRQSFTENSAPNSPQSSSGE